jgi:glutamine amidotransferase
MCRVLGYLGPPVAVEDLMTKPANSLVNQSFDAEYHHLLQLGGTGFASWEQGSPNETHPLIYKSAQPTFFDRNLRGICENTRTTCFLGHIRAVGYSERSSVYHDNCHPFLYPRFRLALAHNGGLPGWRDMLQDILSASRPEIVRHLAGSTDTEPLYCLLMSQYDDPTADMAADEIVAGLRDFLAKVLEIKKKHDNTATAKLKFFLADGNDLVVANLGLGENYATDIERQWDDLRHAKVGSPEFTVAGVLEPVWYMAGDDYADYDGTFEMRVSQGDTASTMIVASEHLTEDSSQWQRIPFQHVGVFGREGDRVQARVSRLTL